MALSLACLLAWPLAGAKSALVLFALAVTAYLVGHLYWLDKLARWLKDPQLADIPTGSGVWEDVFAALYQEMRRQRSSQTELTSALERFQRAAGALPDGVVLLNNSDQIEWCNQTAELKLGLNLALDAGQPIGYLVRQTEFSAYLQAHEYGEPIKLKSARHPDVMLEIQLVPYGDNQKLLLCRDITPLENLETMRRDFIANVSHELRTPLTVVGGFLETLEDMDSTMPDSTRHYFHLMQEQTGRMRRLVEDLLTLSRLESSQHGPKDADVDVPSLLNLVLKEGQSFSGGHHQLSLDADASLHLNGVPEELHSAFGNLVTNAIRYTPDGGEVRLAWGLRGDVAVFSVSDTGIGIEPQHLGRLTERFYRVDSSRSRATGGTGLGLSIVKHILTRHQAHLEVASEYGKGSTFSAVFPAARVVRASGLPLH
ncbi:phosphate regulon sensor protein PhoR [mine drainage metagenome]|uniref:Phosphate regulon sensor protein PhoR n=1 Tax=mine drainage metagenome TaxID=410659 RepID=A0A1J5QMT3_9ZZZZ